MRLDIQRNGYPTRMVVSAGINAAELERARRERENFLRRLRRKDPAVKAKQRAYDRARRADPAVLALDRERKAKWRQENREAYNAYFRRYNVLAPGRLEYKAMKAREYRARKRAAAEASA